MVNNKTFFLSLFARMPIIGLEACWLDCKSVFWCCMCFCLWICLLCRQLVPFVHIFVILQTVFSLNTTVNYSFPLSNINLQFSFVFSLAFNNPRPGQLGRLLPNQNLPLDITLQSPTGAGPFPPIRNSSPYSVIPQPGMMGNQGMIGNQGNLGNSSTGKGSITLLGYLTEWCIHPIKLVALFSGEFFFLC